MRITIEGASPEFEHKLLGLLADYRHELTITADTEWTAERAERFLRSLPLSARTFARLVIDADGSADADTLREHFTGGLRGPTIALSRALTRGVRTGHWPDGTAAPITPLYDPDNPSWQRAIRYEMAIELLASFQEALSRLDNSGPTEGA